MTASGDPHPEFTTVEEVVRHQLSQALGGKRGMLEAAIPTIVFTVLWLIVKDLQVALLSSVAIAVVLLAVRVIQRSSVQFVVNALFGIGIGWLFVTMSARSGGSADDQALAYFLPGILYNGGYAVAIAFSIMIGWPLVGFMIGSVMGDVTAWHDDRGIVSLCKKLTWLLVLPCVIRVLSQGPVWLAGSEDILNASSAVAILGVLKIAMGWPLQIAALSTMAWLLRRDATPLSPQPDAG